MHRKQQVPVRPSRHRLADHLEPVAPDRKPRAQRFPGVLEVPPEARMAFLPVGLAGPSKGLALDGTHSPDEHLYLPLAGTKPAGRYRTSLPASSATRISLSMPMDT